MEWNTLDTLPEDGKDVWVLNKEYGMYSENDPLDQRLSLNIRHARFWRSSGWKLTKCNEYASVKYWMYPNRTN